MSGVPVTIIQARPETIGARLFALWRYRGFYSFLLKEITTRRFRGTLLGYWWLIIRPLVPTVMAIVTFTFVVKMESHGLPYAIFYFSGFIVWNVFHSALVFVPKTMAWMRGVMRRTYFPKLLVPLASIGPTMIETALISGVFIVTLIYFQLSTGSTHLRYGWEMLWFFPCLAMALAFSVAIGIVTSVLALFMRDIIFSLSYFAQMFMFLTPVFYPVSFIPEQYRWILYVANPMAQIVEVSRWSLTGVGDFHPVFLAISFAMIVIIMALSIAFFMRAERYLADEM